MKTSRFLQRSSNLFEENRLLKFIFVVMALAFCFNSVQVNRALNFQRTVLIPPQMTGTIEFVHGQPTESYIKDLSRTLTHLAGTYSPATARSQFDALLRYYHPEAFPAASESWYSLASRAEDSLVSSVFYLDKITVKENEMAIEVFGALRQWAGKTPLEDTSRTYVIRYRIEDGRFFVLSLLEKETSLEVEQENRKNG
jgi:conjugal transfer pilus assembly protein TraE